MKRLCKSCPITLKNKSMASASSPEDLRSTSEGKIPRGDFPCINSQADLKKPIQGDLGSTEFSEQATYIKETLLKETSSDDSSVSTGSPVILSVKLSDCEPFYEKTASSVIDCLTLSQGTACKGDVLSTIDISESSDLRKALCSGSDTKREQTVLDDMNVSNAIKTVLPESLVHAMDFSHCEIDPTPAENLKMLDFQRCDVKGIEDQHQRFEFVNQKALCGGLVVPSKPCTYDSTIFDFSLVSSDLLHSTEELKALEQALKSPVAFDINSNTSLSELLSSLENWARRGLDNAFNIHVNFGSRHIGANLKEDFKYGFGVMKKMINRIYTLMKAAKQLPDPSLLRRFERGKNLIRCDLVDSGLTMWFTIQDLSLVVFHDYKKLKLLCDDVSVKSTKAINMEQDASPNIVISNTYTVVYERLQVLRKQMYDFHDNIRIFCSELDEHL